MKCKYYKPSMIALKEYCKTLYSLEDCMTGGPLHILVDDGNYEDQHIQFCLDECSKQPDLLSSQLGAIICREYQKMSMEERAIFYLYLWGHDLTCKYTNCHDCPRLQEVYDD